MTVIAWDGKTLAADKRAASNGLAYSVTKIFRTAKGLLGIHGIMGTGLLIRDYVNGVSSTYPVELQKADDTYCYALLITPERKIFIYERSEIPALVESAFHACGSGRDYAMAAMCLGKSAKEAVEIACRFDINCGNGIDTLTFDE